MTDAEKPRSPWPQVVRWIVGTLVAVFGLLIFALFAADAAQLRPLAEVAIPRTGTVSAVDGCGTGGGEVCLRLADDPACYQLLAPDLLQPPLVDPWTYRGSQITVLVDRRVAARRTGPCLVVEAVATPDGRVHRVAGADRGVTPTGSTASELPVGYGFAALIIAIGIIPNLILDVRRR